MAFKKEMFQAKIFVMSLKIFYNKCIFVIKRRFLYVKCKYNVMHQNMKKRQAYKINKTLFFRKCSLTIVNYSEGGAFKNDHNFSKF